MYKAKQATNGLSPLSEHRIAARFYMVPIAVPHWNFVAKACHTVEPTIDPDRVGQTLAHMAAMIVAEIKGSCPAWKVNSLVEFRIVNECRVGSALKIHQASMPGITVIHFDHVAVNTGTFARPINQQEGADDFHWQGVEIDYQMRKKLLSSRASTVFGQFQLVQHAPFQQAIRTF